MPPHTHPPPTPRRTLAETSTTTTTTMNMTTTTLRYVRTPHLPHHEQVDDSSLFCFFFPSFSHNTGDVYLYKQDSPTVKLKYTCTEYVVKLYSRSLDDTRYPLSVIRYRLLHQCMHEKRKMTSPEERNDELCTNCNFIVNYQLTANYFILLRENILSCSSVTTTVLYCTNKKEKHTPRG